MSNKVKITMFLLAFMPFFASAKYTKNDCHSWPMNMAEVWLKNSGIVDITNLNESKTKYALLASEKKGKDLYTQVYRFTFYDKSGHSYMVITTSDASNEECSMGSVNRYLVSKSDINY